MKLAKKSDYFLITQINKNASSEAYLELKNRVEKSYYKTLSSYCKKVPQLKYEEMAEQIDEVVLKAAASYRKGKKAQFNSWFTNHSRFFILNNIKKLNELGHFIPTENTELDILNNAFNKVHLDTNKDFKEHVFNLLDNFGDSRLKVIFEDRFFGDKESRKWHNIAAKLNLSTQQISNIYRVAREKIYEEMVKEEYNK